MVNFMPRQFCPRADLTRGLQKQYGRREQKNTLAMCGIEPPIPRSSSALPNHYTDYYYCFFVFFFFFFFFYLAGVKVKQSDLHLFRSAAKLLVSLLSMFLSSTAAITLSFHVDLGRPFPRLSAGLHSNAFLGTLFSDILTICPYQRS
jgi:hypothetical protein